MKIGNILFTVTRSLLSLFGIGQGNCLYFPTCSNLIKESFDIYIIGSKKNLNLKILEIQKIISSHPKLIKK